MLKQKLSKIICLTTIISAIPFYSTFGATGEINGNAVRLRKDPSTDSKIITLLEKGKSVEVITKENGWYNIKAGNNTGWVAEDLLIVEESINEVHSESSQTQNVEIVAVTGNNVNLRQGPTTQTSIVGKVVAGDNLISYGKTSDGLWYKVKFADTEG